MKKVTLVFMLFGAMVMAIASCGGSEGGAEGEATDTTHTEGDGHSH